MLREAGSKGMHIKEIAECISFSSTMPIVGTADGKDVDPSKLSTFHIPSMFPADLSRFQAISCVYLLHIILLGKSGQMSLRTIGSVV